jgi:ribosomal protein S12 methylthiotransferase accessory factor
MQRSVPTWSAGVFFRRTGAGSVSTHWGSARDVAGQDRVDAILDFVPLLQREIDLDSPLLLAAVGTLRAVTSVPFPQNSSITGAGLWQSLFGSSTNGLASGNSLLEASIQALLELIERDIWSFECVRCASRLVETASLPDEVREIVDRAERNGLQLKFARFPTITACRSSPFLCSI